MAASRNRCSSCGHTWHPRGSSLSKRCPHCRSDRVGFDGPIGGESVLTNFKQQCPSCEAMVPIRHPGLIGKKIDCPKCKFRFVVAEADEVDADEEPARQVRHDERGRRLSAKVEGLSAGGQLRLLLIFGGIAGVLCLPLCCAGLLVALAPGQRPNQAGQNQPPPEIVRVIHDDAFAGNRQVVPEARHVMEAYRSDRPRYRREFQGKYIDTPASADDKHQRDAAGPYVLRNDSGAAGQYPDVKVYLHESANVRAVDVVANPKAYRLRVLVTGEPPSFAGGRLVKTGE